jgi:hypothetical protein
MTCERPIQLLEALVLVLIGDARHFSALFARVDHQRLGKRRAEIGISFTNRPLKYPSLMRSDALRRMLGLHF